MNQTQQQTDLLPSPPRQVRKRERFKGRVEWTTLVLLPFAIVGVVLLALVPFHFSFVPPLAVVIIFDLGIAGYLLFIRIPVWQRERGGCDHGAVPRGQA